MKFYLGTHQPHWLGLVDIPLMVSHNRLKQYKNKPRALGEWMQDSGGFTQLSMYGKWTFTDREYVKETRRNHNEVSNLSAAAIMDWMCEPVILKKTGLTVKKHQENTIQSYLDLIALDPDLPWMPVLQGWSLDDYMRHVDMYESAGIDLKSQALVGIGTVCRRQGTKEAARIIETLSGFDIKLHGFGVKLTGLQKVSNLLSSADSMAWSFAARKDKPLEGCSHKNCANCLKYALIWYEKVNLVCSNGR